MVSQFVILKEFKKQLIKFLDELIEQFPTEGDLVILRIFVKDQAPIMDLINHFVSVILPLKDKVKNRDERFFIDNHILMYSDPEYTDMYADKDKINYLKNLWTSDYIDSDNKKIIWEWFDMFVNLTEKYKKTQVNQVKVQG